MTIERISDTQLKYIFMVSDLEERNIRINELSYGSEKTDQLFKEIMLLLQNEQDFSMPNTPLMLEAMRVGVDSLVVMVTKVNQQMAHQMTGEPKFNLNPIGKSDARFKKQDFIKNQSPAIDSHSVFSFDTIDNMATATSLLAEAFVGPSSAYKLDDRYFLHFQNETPNDVTTEDFESILFEYGQKHVSNVVSHQYLLEHGEVLIAEDAIHKLKIYNS